MKKEAKKSSLHSFSFLSFLVVDFMAQSIDDGFKTTRKINVIANPEVSG